MRQLHSGNFGEVREDGRFASVRGDGRFTVAQVFRYYRLFGKVVWFGYAGFSY